MARIVYGISGEGSGHSSRAREMLSHLLARGHEICAVSYDRGYRNLKESFPVDEIVGLGIASVDNKVSPIRTVLENLRNLPDGIKSFRKTRRELFKHFKPDAVITDFEPTTAYLANYYNVPLISLDNQHRMRYMSYHRPANLARDALLTETVIRAMVPRPDISLITTFHFSELKNTHSFLFPPILREAVRNLKISNAGHILVYATSGFDSLLEKLKTFKQVTFLIYGYDKQGQEGNLHFRPFSKTGFIDDLASSKAVIATAGFTLITESLFLAKPYFALPMKGQFEQALNALMLEEQGYGKASFNINCDEVGAFLDAIPQYQQSLKDYPRAGNEKITGFLDHLFDNNLQGVQEHRRKDF